jgi:predicted nucleic acid-binding protein
LIVIDASATVALILNEDAAATNEQTFRKLGADEVLVPSHWIAEVGNALIINIRRQRLNRGQFEFVTATLEQMKIRVEPPPTYGEMIGIVEQASNLGLTYYDAAYVEKARAYEASLFTFDEKMRQVATRLNISLLPS